MTIVNFDAKYLPAFKELNQEWIQTYFKLEPNDIKQLESPYDSILSPGGEILFLLVADVVVGTVALIPHGPGCFEIAKMAIAPHQRGNGYGDVLMSAAESWARSHSASRLMLLSNTSLTAAISLYTKHGFATIHLGKHPDYDRCNIEMEKILTVKSER